uniref:Uncharacterized protein n=1 Tax=Arundo donax TaxID=35708 RepID=A0A0A9A3M1_ARUDO
MPSSSRAKHTGGDPGLVRASTPAAASPSVSRHRGTLSSCAGTLPTLSH